MRHPNVRNADEVEVREMIKGRHNMRLRQLGKPAGSIALGATLTEVAPGGDWSNPESFSAGQKFPGHPIAQFMRPEFLDLQFESFSFSQHAITETLVASQDFIFGGNKYNFNQLTPGGVTLYNYVSNTPLPAVAGFPLVLPYAGNCVAVGSGDWDNQQP